MKRYIALAIALSASPAMGHPGHGAATAGHWISDLTHLAALGAAGIAVALIIKAARTRAKSVKIRK